MDWVINTELQFTIAPPHEHKTAEEVRVHIKRALDLLIEAGFLNHYHLLSAPRRVDS